MGRRCLLTLVICACVLKSLSSKPKKIEIQLVGGTESAGRVEVRLSRADPWGTVCDDYWRNTGATVVCRMLGFKFGKAFRNAHFGQGTGPIYMDDVRCKGSETSLIQCHYSGWKIHSCFHSEDAGAACFNTSVTIIGSIQNTTASGAVQMWQVTGLKPICDVDWDDKEAEVVCKELGYVSGKSLCCSRLSPFTYSPYVYPRVAFTRFRCTGTEKSLIDCKHTVTSRCKNNHLASVMCYKKHIEDDKEIQTRLSKGSTNWGTIEIKYRGIWGHVCSSDWSDHMSSLVCISQGFQYGMNFGRAPAISELSIWVSSLNNTCSANATSLKDCVTPSWGKAVGRCYPNRVLCLNTNITLKLIGPTKNAGRVEITFNNETGSICDSFWYNQEARVVCRQLGYSDGTAILGSYYGKGKGPVFMDHVSCRGNEKEIWQCRSTGWKVLKKRCRDHTNDASVVCVSDVRLVRGDHSHGIVQVVNKHGKYRSWYSLCGFDFGNKEARVVCRQLGFPNGSRLPSVSYGRLHYLYNPNSFRCLGNESSIQSCSVHRSRCTRGNHRYSSVACNNGSISNETSIRLVGGADRYDTVSGRVQVIKNGVNGRICQLYWNDRDANVTCRQLGHAGGVAYWFSSPRIGPYFMTHVRCLGNESSLLDCKTRSGRCRRGGDAGVLCYKTRGVRVELVGATETSGLVEVIYEGRRGTVCLASHKRWQVRRTATVACRHLGFSDGSITKVNNTSSNSNPVVLANLACYGFEKTIFQCRHSRWGEAIPTSCLSHDNDLRVTCYSKVRVVAGESSSNRTSGMVWFLEGRTWLPICTSGFDQNAADIACRELHHQYAVIPAPGTFMINLPRPFDRYLHRHKTFVNNINCTGSETSLDACSRIIGRCSNRFSLFASVICTNIKLSDDITVTLDKTFPSSVAVTKYGVRSSVCQLAWNDQIARVVCKESGYANGLAFRIASNDKILSGRFSAFSCHGNETTLTSCALKETPPFFCRRAGAAGVYCYDKPSSSPKVRLVSRRFKFAGRVEMFLNGRWGTICDRWWTLQNAMVVCRQLGLPYGLPVTGIPPGAGPSWLHGVTCSGREESVWNCPYSGFNVNFTDCATHKHDVGVKCSDVRLWPGLRVGVVEVYDGRSSYGMICSDDFSDADASVICRDRGYSYGVRLCCSAFGPQPNPITITRLQCTGREFTLSECPRQKSLTYCPSMQYASVVCSSVNPKSGFRLKLTDKSYGRIQIYYMRVYGDVCPDRFNNKDAAVVCRQIGYKYAFTYTHYTSDWGQRSKSFYWFGDLECDGSESVLSQCKGAVLGNGGNCRRNGFAAVYCYNTPGYGLKFRLSNKTGNTGRVDISLNNQWGSICSDDKLNDVNAAVLCRQLGYKDGISARGGRFGTSGGHVLLYNLNCTGHEMNVAQCSMAVQLDHNPNICKRRVWDTTVTCYDTVRLVRGMGNYGRVEMSVNGSWLPVCDQTFSRTTADVVCKHLGFADGIAQCCSAVGRIVDVDHVSISHCPAEADDLKKCRYTVGACPGGHYVSVYCSHEDINPEKQNTNVHVRINQNNPKSPTYFGPLEIKWLPSWGLICPNFWHNKSASVACRHMGWKGGVAMWAMTNSNIPMILTAVVCTGDEKNMTSCSMNEFSAEQSCSERLDKPRPCAGVICYDEGITVQLSGGSHRHGWVSVNYDGEVGSVCSTGFDDVAASVVCRQLGFKEGVSSVAAYSAANTSRVWIRNVTCSGLEESIFGCRIQWNSNNSVECTSAGVLCFNSARLVHGNNVNFGMVKVRFGETWGAICDTYWDEVDTSVICKELGFQHGASFCCGSLGDGMPSLMDEVACSGDESHVVDCLHVVPMTKLCTGHNVAVACYNQNTTSAFSWRLGGGNYYTGEVLVDFMNITGRICPDEWDQNDAQVACRELGFAKGLPYTHYVSGKYATDHRPYWTSRVSCSGSEEVLANCSMTALGTVQSCSSGFSAGLQCFKTSGVFYRLTGSTSRRGRVEVSVDGTWGSVCGTDFDDIEAAVLCKTLGYVGGALDNDVTLQVSDGPVYEGAFRCSGDETDLSDCPQEGWHQATSGQCVNHKNDVAVVCFNIVQVTGTSAPKQGPLQLYYKSSWNVVCDVGFDDVTASIFCHQMGYFSGKSICCSAYGQKYNSQNIGDSKESADDSKESADDSKENADDSNLNWYSLHCRGNENSPLECNIQPGCKSNLYASVVCSDTDHIYDENYKFNFKSASVSSGPIIIQHRGTYGYLCDTSWKDVDAGVFCRSQGFFGGIAWHLLSSSDGGNKKEFDMPYLASEINCHGEELSLQLCSLRGRSDMGNCSTGNIAAAICWNQTEEGISYRLSGGGKTDGRVEISVGGVWGTICGLFWDDREAGVLCRQLGHSDGYAINNSPYGSGTGPVWLSHLRCRGSESSLHKCPHAGFKNELSTSGETSRCDNHSDEAAVYCIGAFRLSAGYNASQGAVELYKNSSWVAVCDHSFNKEEATIVCRSLGYQHGVDVPGSRFGCTVGPVGIIKVHCTGHEVDITQCSMIESDDCITGSYASVVCAHQPIIDSGLEIRIIPDIAASSFHGYLEVKQRGIWGDITMAGLDKTGVNLACTDLGYTWGVKYAPTTYGPRLRNIIQATQVSCDHMAKSLKDCDLKTSQGSSCDYDAQRAGILCFSHSETIFRLSGHLDSMPGRVEMRFEGQWGVFCSTMVNPQAAAKVSCKSVGFIDGLPLSGLRFVRTDTSVPVWFHQIECSGRENTLLECISDGFNKTSSIGMANQCDEPLAVKCYNSELAITDIRLVNDIQQINDVDNNDLSGRLELYLHGAESWGTVCGQLWDNVDATVVCRQLGYETGETTDGGRFGLGSGPIWMTDVGCRGMERRIQDCSYTGFYVDGCRHTQDVGVICRGLATKDNDSQKHLEQEKHKQSFAREIPPSAIAVPTVMIILTVACLAVGTMWYRRRHEKDEINEHLVDDSPHGPISLGTDRVHFVNDPASTSNEGESGASVEGIDNPVYSEANPPVDYDNASHTYLDLQRVTDA